MKGAKFGVGKLNRYGHALVNFQIIWVSLASTSQSFSRDRNFGNFLRKIYQENGVEYCHEAMIWIVKNAQFFWEFWE